MGKSLKMIWIVLSAAVLAMTLFAFDGDPRSDAAIFFAWCMLFLSFPAGLFVSLVHTFASETLGITIATSYVSIFIDWLGFLLLGYMQWFILLPGLWKRFRARP